MFLKMPESDKVEYHIEVHIPQSYVVGWKRYVANFPNASEAFMALSEVRMNKPPASLEISGD